MPSTMTARTSSLTVPDRGVKRSDPPADPDRRTGPDHDPPAARIDPPERIPARPPSEVHARLTAGPKGDHQVGERLRGQGVEDHWATMTKTTPCSKSLGKGVPDPVSPG
jgi:hypothetical protein